MMVGLGPLAYRCPPIILTPQNYNKGTLLWTREMNYLFMFVGHRTPKITCPTGPACRFILTGAHKRAVEALLCVASAEFVVETSTEEQNDCFNDSCPTCLGTVVQNRKRESFQGVKC